MEFEFDLQMFADAPVLPVIGTDYQLLWDKESFGLIEVKASSSTKDNVTTWDAGKFTIAEQTTKTTFARPTTGTKYYLAVKNAYTTEEGKNNLEIGGIVAVDATDSTPKWEYYDGIENVEAKGVATVTAPSTALTFNAAAATGMTVTINNLAKDSAITLKAGDQATTGKLAAGEKVTAGGFEYVSAGGALTLVGKTVTTTTTETVDEQEVTTTSDTHSTVLSAGDVKVTTGSTLTLAGASAKNEDDITVATTDANGIIVKAKAGKVTGITGLDGANATVTVTEPAVKTTKIDGIEFSVTTTTTYTYTALDADGTMIQRLKSVSVNGGTPTETTEFVDLKAGGDIYTARYQAASVTNVIGRWGSGEKATTDGVFYYLSTANAAANATSMVDANSVTDNEVRKIENGKFQANAGAYYLKVNSSTKAATATAPITTTISSVEGYKGNAAGALTKITTPAYTGTITYAVGDSDPARAFVYNKPANATFHVNITGADIRSKFTGLQLGTDADSVTTKDATYTDLTAGTYNIYKGTALGETITVTGKMNVKVTGGEIAEVTGFNSGEKITIADNAGGIKVYQCTGFKTVESVKYAVFTLEETGSTGAYTKIVGALLPAEGLEAADILTASFDTSSAVTTQSIVTDFDWTTKKSSVGYFAAGTSATVKTQKTNITSTVPANYIKAVLGDDGAVSLSAVTVNNTGEVGGTSTFTGTLNITAPNTAITLSARGVDDSATLKITNLAAGSVIAAAALTNAKDTVTTGRLAEGAMVSVAGNEYYSGVNNGTLTINSAGLFSGTVKVGNTEGAGTIKVGAYAIKDANSNVEDTAFSAYPFTVTATGGKTFSLGALKDGAKVTVTTTEGATPAINGTFVKYGTFLYNFDTYTEGTSKMYSLGTGTTITSANMDTSKTVWKTAYDTSTNEFVTSTVKLALADKAITAGTTSTDIKFVRDKYMTAQPTKATNVAATVATAASDFAVEQGTVAASTNGMTNKYTATTAQTIEVTNGWEVAAAEGKDTTIKGAASGKDYLAANTGNDTITLSGAEDVVDETAFGGKDTITGYTSGKDKLVVADDAQFVLSTTTANDVYVTDDGSIESDYALLKGVGGKAVTINGATHYFGNGLENKAGKTTAGSFIYEEGAFYHGNNSGANTLKVNTLKGKATSTYMGEAVKVDLTTDAANYTGIDIVDATASANEVELTASANGSTLKGGTYKSTLTAGAKGDTLWGGTGADTFVLGEIDGGHDTVKNYASDKDVLQVTGTVEAALFSASGKNVLIGHDGAEDTDYVTVENAVGKALTVDDGTNKTEVFVGEEGKANSFQTKDGAGIFVGSSGTDTIKVVKSLAELNLGNPVTDEDAATITYTVSKYQGGTIDLTSTNYSSIDAVDASGVKATGAAVSEFGSKFVKAHAGVNVKAYAAGEGNEGTTFTGSAFNDKFTCNTGKDTINYTAGQGDDIIAGFGVDDVIKLNGLSAADIASLESNAGTALTNGFSAGGKLTGVEAAEGYTLKFTKTGTNAGTITQVTTGD